MNPQAPDSLYHRLILLMLHTKRHLAVMCETSDITPVQAIVLLAMQPGQSRTMHELSELMGCDASNVTGLIDRLDSHGYIERSSDPFDRRVKTITLSSHGTDTRTEMLAALQEAQAIDLQALSPTEQNRLARLLDKLG